jgi:hypothetical protein
MGTHGFTRLTTVQTWGKPQLSPLIVFSVISHWGYIQMSCCPKTPKLQIPKLSKIESHTILEAHNFLCEISIEMRCQAKL